MNNNMEYRNEMNGASRTPKQNLMEAKRLILDASNNIYEEKKNDIQSEISDFKSNVEDVKKRVRENAFETKESIETQVKERPWTFVFGATLAGSLIGFLLGRRYK